MRWKELGILIVLSISFSSCGLGYMLLSPQESEPPKEAAQTMVTENYLRPANPRAGLRVRPEHFVSRWMVLGAFPYESGQYGGDQEQGAVRVAFAPSEPEFEPAPGKEAFGKTWVRAAGSPYIDFDALYGGLDFAAAYALCDLYSPKEYDDLVLYAGSDDYITVWINGERVHQYAAERRVPAPDDDVVKNVSLKRGVNRIVVKCVEVVGDWGFYLRFASEEGDPMEVVDRPSQP